MRKRTKSRECALKILYQLDINKSDLKDSLESFYNYRKLSPAIKEFANLIAEGTVKNLKQIDKIISKCAQNWAINRMAVIDRNILRMSVFELIFIDDIPPKVSINEAIEIAKRYGDKDSSKFVNGILDRVLKVYKNKSSNTKLKLT